LIFKKISKIGATRRQILRLKCTKIDFGCGSAPEPAGGAYSAPPDPLAVFKGPTSKGKEGEGKRGGKGQGREGKGSENDLTHSLSQIPGYTTALGPDNCTVQYNSETWTTKEKQKQLSRFRDDDL